MNRFHILKDCKEIETISGNANTLIRIKQLMEAEPKHYILNSDFSVIKETKDGKWYFFDENGTNVLVVSTESQYNCCKRNYPGYTVVRGGWLTVKELKGRK